MILGWDVGIKNLAFAGLDKLASTPDNTFTLGDFVFNIKIWDTINITQQVASNNLDGGSIVLTEAKLKCAHQVVKGSKKAMLVADCGRKASHIAPNGTCGICATHLELYPSSKVFPITSKPLCCYSNEKGICSKKAVCVERYNNYKGYCKKHQTLQNGVEFLILGKKISAQHINLTKLGLALYQELDKRPQILDGLNTVLLENQPVLKNPTMKSVQMLLYGYFIMRGIQQKTDAGEEPVGDIKCYMASNKTKLLANLPEVEQTRIKGEMAGIKESYQVNKKTSIAIVRYILAQNANRKWLDFFETHGKKDDLADALLMTIHYMI